MLCQNGTLSNFCCFISCDFCLLMPEQVTTIVSSIVFLDHNYTTTAADFWRGSLLSSVMRDFSHCFQDHNYARPPPPLPHPNSSSASDQMNIDDVSCHTTVTTTTAMLGESGQESWEGSVTRCICEFKHDDGYMICCDRCGSAAFTWNIYTNLHIIADKLRYSISD